MAALLLEQAIPFSDFADLLEKVSNSSSVADKDRRLTEFVKLFREKFVEQHQTPESCDASNNDSIFSIIRLLYPIGDRKRASYNFKSVALSKMFAKILGLDKGSAEGRKLLDYKDPLKSVAGTTDLGMIVFLVMEKRFSHQGSADGHGPKLSDLHQVLDQLARGRTNKDAVTQDKQVKILQKFIRKLTPLEGKWLVRILLKDLMLGVNKNQIFKLIHPKAAELMNRLDLEGVCKKLNNPFYVLTDDDAAGITLFSFFKPMLCTRLDQIDGPASNRDGGGSGSDDDEESSTSRGRKAKQRRASQPVKLPAPPFILETKWDGERFQIHYQRGTGSQKHIFKYFTRNGHDYTASFKETLSPRLVAQFVDEPPVSSFILDGEMMAWNKETKSFTLKGGNVDVKTLAPDSKHCPLFTVFDVLLYNGQTVHNKPLSERTEYLRQILIPEESICHFSEHTIVQDKASVTDALNDAIDKREEGLVVKTIYSVYQPGKRGSDWLKIKPEYIGEHAVDDLDLLILGAYYSDSTLKARGTITNFLVGLVGDNKKEFYPLVTVGFGSLNHRERQELMSNLQELLVNREFPSIKHGRRRKPDLHVDPKRSVVVQVKASEITPTKEYEIKHTLRFPRITRTRFDKNWDDAMSVKEFTDLRRSCDGKLAKKSNAGGRPPWLKNRSKPAAADSKGYSSEDDTPAVAAINKSPVKRKGLAKSPVESALSILAAKSKSSGPGKSISMLGNAKKSTIFSGRVFCVIGDPHWVLETSNLLTIHGAKEIIPNPMLDCMCIVAEKESHRIKNYEKNGSFDIAKQRIWMGKCIEANRLLNFEPEDLFFATEVTKKSFANEYDQFGDSYTKPSTLQEVKTLVQNVMEQQQTEPPMTPKELNSLKRELNEEFLVFSPMKGCSSKSKLSKWSFMSGCKIAFRGHPPAATTIAEVQFYGGQIADRETEKGVTHIVVGVEATKTKRPNSSVFVVKPEWLLDTLVKREQCPETEYVIS